MRLLGECGLPWLAGDRRRRSTGAPGNIPPIALPDSASALAGQTVSIPVLANDIDPEQGALTIIEATADVGSVVITGQFLEYTAPAGFSGPATLDYTIADPVGALSSSTVAVDVVDPQLSLVVTPEETLILDAETGELTITISAPSAYAGSYVTDTALMAAGPVNLVSPAISGVPAVGETLSAVPGLWIYDGDATPPLIAVQWRRDGADLLGETAATYQVVAADQNASIDLVETADGGAGVASPAIVVAATVLVDTDFGASFPTDYPDIWSGMAGVDVTIEHRPTETWNAYGPGATDGGIVGRKLGNYPYLGLPIPVTPGASYEIEYDLPIGELESGSFDHFVRVRYGEALNDEAYGFDDFTADGHPRLATGVKTVTIAIGISTLWLTFIVESPSPGADGGNPAVSRLVIREV